MADTEVTRVSLEWLKGRNNTSEPLHFTKQIGELLFEGDFVFRRPDRMTEDAIAVRYGLLTSHFNPQLGTHEEVPIVDGDALFARAQAVLEFVVVKSPDWWDLDLLIGFRDVVTDVFVELYLKWEGSFRRAVEKAPQGSDQATGSGAVANPPLQSPTN